MITDIHLCTKNTLYMLDTYFEYRRYREIGGLEDEKLDVCASSLKW